MLDFKIVLLIVCLHQLNWLSPVKCDGISSILFPFSAVVNQNVENKHQERNLSLRNRYQSNYPSAELRNQASNTNLLNKLTLDKQNPKTPNLDRTIVPDLYCEKEEFLCHDKLRCIPKALVCDSVQNCIDSSDEIGCINSCRGNEFKCTNQKCIDEKYICDTFDDCGDWSDELNCIGTGKIPQLTGNLKLDLDSFESLENQNIIFQSPKSHTTPVISQTDPNHPNKHPDTFNSQLNKQANNQISQANHPNRQPNQNYNYNPTTSTTTAKPSTITTAGNQAANEAINQTKQPTLTNRTKAGKDASTSPKKNENKTNTYEAPYVKIFPLTPVVKSTESAESNRVAFNNYAILTNKSVNSTDKTDKSLIESLGFGGTLNNKSIESPKQEVQASSSKTVKLGQNKGTSMLDKLNSSNVQPNKVPSGNTPIAGQPNIKSKIQASSSQPTKQPNTSALALSGHELANEKKLQLSNLKKTTDKSNTNDQLDKILNSNQNSNNKELPAANRSTSIDVSKSNPDGQRLAFSISLPKATEPTKLKQNANRKNKTKDSKDENVKKLNCRKNPQLEACKHCSYGLFRCSMGKCVITSFECGMNATNSTRGRRVSVNVNDFLQFV